MLLRFLLLSISTTPYTGYPLLVLLLSLLLLRLLPSYIQCDPHDCDILSQQAERGTSASAGLLAVATTLPSTQYLNNPLLLLD